MVDAIRRNAAPVGVTALLTTVVLVGSAYAKLAGDWRMMKHGYQQIPAIQQQVNDIGLDVAFMRGGMTEASEARARARLSKK